MGSDATHDPAAARAASPLGTVLDYAIVPLFLTIAATATYRLLQAGFPALLVAAGAVAPLVVAAAVLERVRPERETYRRLDLPLGTEAAHFVFNYHFGYALAVGGYSLVALGIDGRIEPLWPTSWPFALQIALAIFAGEAASYWQHRLAHRLPWLWRFHALHHSGERLNLIRAGRFHFVDVASGAFLVFVPLVVLGAPEVIVTWAAALNATLGILEHTNTRIRTPSFLDWVLCTPAVHRHHHSRDFAESNHNFCTTFTLFDVLFGTFQKPRPDGPVAMGVEDDPVPRTGFWAQLTTPFRRA